MESLPEAACHKTGIPENRRKAIYGTGSDTKPAAGILLAAGFANNRLKDESAAVFHIVKCVGAWYDEATGREMSASREQFDRHRGGQLPGEQ